MVTYEQVINGLTKFIDNEIISQLSGNQKILLGIGAGVALRKGENLYNGLKNNSMIKMLGIINEDKIDIETLYEEAKKQATKEVIRVEIPMIGTLKLNEDDIEKLYGYIKNS